jgi:hypothetical protein
MALIVGCSSRIVENPTDADIMQARSYLAANCSFCHNPTGPGLGNMDFRFHATEAELNVVKIKTTEGNDILGDLYRVDPGNPHESALYKRMESLNNAIRMPPLASSVVDGLGLEIVDSWIKGL